MSSHESKTVLNSECEMYVFTFLALAGKTHGLEEEWTRLFSNLCPRQNLPNLYKN